MHQFYLQLARLPARGGLRAVFRADAADVAGEPGRRLAWAQPLPDARVRGAVAQGGAQAGGHPGVDRARGPRLPRLGGERQGQGRDRAGLRVPKHRQPHGPRILNFHLFALFLCRHHITENISYGYAQCLSFLTPIC